LNRILVAGVGNIFLGDDGFGVEVARRLGRISLPDGVTVADFGIRGVHLAYQLLDDFELVVLVDAVSRGGAPGTVYVIEPEVDGSLGGGSEESIADAHDMILDHVFAQVRTLGGKLGRILIVGCEAEDTSERIGLSSSVQSAVDEAVRVIVELIDPSRSTAVECEKEA
jgi:hydrogenase maturation protease